MFGIYFLSKIRKAGTQWFDKNIGGGEFVLLGNILCCRFDGMPCLPRVSFLYIVYKWIFHHIRFLFFFWSEFFVGLGCWGMGTPRWPLLVLGEVVWPSWKLFVVNGPCGILVCVAGLKLLVSHLMLMDDEGMNGGWEILSACIWWCQGIYYRCTLFWLSKHSLYLHFQSFTHGRLFKVYIFSLSSD